MDFSHSFFLFPLSSLSLLSLSLLFSKNKVCQFYSSADRVLQLVKICEYDCRISLRLCFKLNLLPLTRQLSSVCGSLWRFFFIIIEIFLLFFHFFILFILFFLGILSKVNILLKK